jgi:ketosteroid isomerase-like protein
VPSANLDLVRSIYADWERGDFFSKGEWADVEIDWAVLEGPESSSGRGLATMAAAWRDFLGAWDGLRAEAREYRELDDERVLVLTRNTGRGKTSGLELGEMYTFGANLFHVRGGKVTRLILYWNGDHALADLGLAQASDPLQES